MLGIEKGWGIGSKNDTGRARRETAVELGKMRSDLRSGSKEDIAMHYKMQSRKDGSVK